MESVTVERLGKCYRVGKKKKQPDAGLIRSLAGLLPGRSRPADRRIRERWALRDVSFTVAPGEILGVIGPNGAGKTTLLKILGRVTLPTEGRAVVRGRVISLLEVGAGFQAELSGRDNVFLNAALYGISRQEVLRKFDDIVEFAELGEFIDIPVKRYSSGMYIRLAFSVAINLEPDVLLADEVLAVGDLAFQERCLQRVKAAGTAGLSVLFVSHDMAAIRRLCDRVIWLSSGSVVEQGEPESVIANYERSAWAHVAEQDRSARGGRHRRGHGELLGTRLLSAEGEEIGAARTFDEAVVDLTFRTTTPNVRARCDVVVYTRGMLAFRSAQPSDELIIEPGVYSARLRIPADLLSDAIYSLKSRVVLVKDGEESALVQDNALSFRAYGPDERPPELETYRDQKPGALSPRLEWQLSRVRDVVAV